MTRLSHTITDLLLTQRHVNNLNDRANLPDHFSAYLLIHGIPNSTASLVTGISDAVVSSRVTEFVKRNRNIVTKRRDIDVAELVAQTALQPGMNEIIRDFKVAFQRIRAKRHPQDPALLHNVALAVTTARVNGIDIRMLAHIAGVSERSIAAYVTKHARICPHCEGTFGHPYKITAPHYVLVVGEHVNDRGLGITHHCGRKCTRLVKVGRTWLYTCPEHSIVREYQAGKADTAKRLGPIGPAQRKALLAVRSDPVEWVNTAAKIFASRGNKGLTMSNVAFASNMRPCHAFQRLNRYLLHVENGRIRTQDGKQLTTLTVPRKYQKSNARNRVMTRYVSLSEYEIDDTFAIYLTIVADCAELWSEAVARHKAGHPFITVLDYATASGVPLHKAQTRLATRKGQLC